MAITVTKAKRMVLKKAARPLTFTPAQLKAKRAKLTKKQIAKRLLPKPISGKEKRARLTKRQIAKRRAKGITTASVVNRPLVKPNAATIKPRPPVTPRTNRRAR